MMRNIKVPLHHQAGDITIHTARREYLSITFLYTHAEHRKPLSLLLYYYYTPFFLLLSRWNKSRTAALCAVPSAPPPHTIHGRFGLSANAVLYRLPVITADDIPHKFDYRHTTEREKL